MVEAQLVEDLGDLVVDRVHPAEPVAVRRQPPPGELEGGGVAVDADDAGVLEALEDRLGVAAEAEGAVDEDRAGVVERGGEQCHDPVEEHRDVRGAGHVSGPGSSGA